jgi:hypothetical protein
VRCMCGCWDDEHELIEPGRDPGACTSCGCDGFELSLDDELEGGACADPGCDCRDVEPRGRPVITLSVAGGLL